MVKQGSTGAASAATGAATTQSVSADSAASVPMDSKDEDVVGYGAAGLFAEAAAPPTLEVRRSEFVSYCKEPSTLRLDPAEAKANPAGSKTFLPLIIGLISKQDPLATWQEVSVSFALCR